jgi:GNAT superfamily N-acetyltransferase
MHIDDVKRCLLGSLAEDRTALDAIPYVFDPFLTFALPKAAEFGVDDFKIAGDFRFNYCDEECKEIIYSAELRFWLNRKATYAQGTGSYSQPLAGFCLSTMPGCGAVLISHDTYVYPEFRGQGLGSLMQDLKVKYAQILRVSKLIATVREDNRIEVGVLRGRGWVPNREPFPNRRSGNRIRMWEKTINID